MVKTKSQSKKPPSRGIDFKKIKRKIGRRLPPPKNTTNTEIKSKAIILPEQSIASEKAGLAVSRKGLTLKELLQHTSHHNAKVRKDAVIGVKDILVKHPNELKLHKLAVIEKLRERIGDDDKFVRETLYQLFKSTIFPACPKDNQGQLVSLVMAYTFNAMTHLSIDVRLMAFKFSDLVIQFYPSSFSLYAEKILLNYEDILRRNQLLEDKNKLKTILTGLIRCLSLLTYDKREDNTTTKNEVASHDTLHAFEPEISRKSIGFTNITDKLKDLLPILVNCCQDFLSVVHTSSQLDVQSCDFVQFILQSIDLTVRFLASMTTSDHFLSTMVLKKLWDVFPLDFVHHLSVKDDDGVFLLNTVITKIFLQSSNWKYSPSALVEKFLEFIESSLTIKIQSGQEKHLVPLISFIPELAMQISGDWRWRILQAFTEAFVNSNSESTLKLSCLSAVQEMLAPERSWFDLDENDATLLHCQIAWIQSLPSLLISLDNKNPSCSKAILQLQLCVGKTVPLNSPLSREFDNMQYALKDFYSSQIDEDICYGPFIRLGADLQELAMCCLYYFSKMGFQLLQSIVSCCLCDDLEPSIVFRILEILQSAFRAGHIEVAEYASFNVTILSRFQVHPENIYHDVVYEGKSNRRIFKSITSVICSCLSQLGDDCLVLEMLEKIIVDQIHGKTSLDNKCAFLRLLALLDSNPTKLSDQSILNISHVLPQYLIEVVSEGEKHCQELTSVAIARRRQYYLLPSFCLFQKNKRLLNLVLDMFVTWVTDINSSFSSHNHHPSTDRSTRLCAIVSLLLHMHKDEKIRQIVLSFKIKIENSIQNLLNMQSSEGINMTLEEMNKVQTAHDRLTAIIDNELEGCP